MLDTQVPAPPTLPVASTGAGSRNEGSTGASAPTESAGGPVAGTFGAPSAPASERPDSAPDDARSHLHRDDESATAEPVSMPLQRASAPAEPTRKVAASAPGAVPAGTSVVQRMTGPIDTPAPLAPAGTRCAGRR